MSATPSSTATVIGPRSMHEMAAFQQELDAIHQEVRQSLGERDARYIRGILRTVRHGLVIRSFDDLEAQARDTDEP